MLLYSVIFNKRRAIGEFLSGNQVEQIAERHFETVSNVPTIDTKKFFATNPSELPEFLDVHVTPSGLVRIFPL